MINLIGNIGIDIIENKRIKKLYQKNKKFIYKFLHKNEIKLLEKKIEYSQLINFLSGRWAAKEAIFKVLETPVLFKNIDINYWPNN